MDESIPNWYKAKDCCQFCMGDQWCAPRLGPLLFILFVNDTPSSVNNFGSLFANDTKIHAALYDYHISYTTSLQEDLTMLQNWTVEYKCDFILQNA